MITIELPIPEGLNLRRADGSPLAFGPAAPAQISFQRVVHPALAAVNPLPADTPEYLRIDHRFEDVSGRPFVFTSHIPSAFLWEQLYDNEAYVDRDQMLERESFACATGPWRETVLVDAIRGSDDIRFFRAFRIHPFKDAGHPDVVPVFTKHHTWMARLSWFTAPAKPSLGSMTQLFVITFTSTPIFTALRDVTPDGDATWQDFDLPPPFHYCVGAYAWLWRHFEEPDPTNSWRPARPPVLCTPGRPA